MLTCVLNGLCMTLLQQSYMSSEVDCMCILPHQFMDHVWYQPLLVYTCILVFNDKLIIGKKNCLENESLSKFTLVHTAQLLDDFAALLITTGRYRYMDFRAITVEFSFCQVYNTTCMQGTNETDGACYCIESYTFYHTAKSPAFDLEQYHSAEFSTWVESR